jgi:hypothetical protein
MTEPSKDDIIGALRIAAAHDRGDGVRLDMKTVRKLVAQWDSLAAKLGDIPQDCETAFRLIDPEPDQLSSTWTLKLWDIRRNAFRDGWRAALKMH